MVLGDSTETFKQGALFADRYQIKSALGSGGMGDVYLVADTLLENSEFALKVLHQSLAQDFKQRQRFLREVQLTRRIVHKNIVRTFDVGEVDGRIYFLMEYVPGYSLKDLLVEKPQLTVEQAVPILLDMASGLAAIHKEGVIHRDLKPANIILSNKEGIARITDFGVARPHSSDLTHHDEVVGSTAYLAPEGWMGTDISALTDIYALGVVAYEMLAGVQPIEANSPAEYMFKHIEYVPLKISKFSASIPAWLEQLVMQMLEKDQGNRPQSALEIVQILEAAMGDPTALYSEKPVLEEGPKTKSSTVPPVEQDFIPSQSDLYENTFQSNAASALERPEQEACLESSDPENLYTSGKIVAASFFQPAKILLFMIGVVASVCLAILISIAMPFIIQAVESFGWERLIGPMFVLGLFLVFLTALVQALPFCGLVFILYRGKNFAKRCEAATMANIKLISLMFLMLTVFKSAAKAKVGASTEAISVIGARVVETVQSTVQISLDVILLNANSVFVRFQAIPGEVKLIKHQELTLSSILLLIVAFWMLAIAIRNQYRLAREVHEAVEAKQVFIVISFIVILDLIFQRYVWPESSSQTFTFEFGVYALQTSIYVAAGAFLKWALVIVACNKIQARLMKSGY